MEIGTTIISTAEYMELRAMKDNLEARKAEIEANADKIVLEERYDHYGYLIHAPRVTLIGKIEALRIMDEKLTETAKARDTLRETTSIQASKIATLEKEWIDPTKIDRSPRGRLHFLFTGELFKTKW